MRSAREAGVKFIACDMAMDIMGISQEELIEVDEIAGVATFASLAKNSNNTLFIWYSFCPDAGSGSADLIGDNRFFLFFKIFDKI